MSAPQRPETAGPPWAHGHACPVQCPRHALPVDAGEFRDAVGRQPTAQVEVNQPLWRTSVRCGGIFGSSGAVGAWRGEVVAGHT
jgi:hypothetical protein